MKMQEYQDDPSFDFQTVLELVQNDFYFIISKPLQL